LISRSIAASASWSSGATSEIASPVRPARPVRPDAVHVSSLSGDVEIDHLRQALDVEAARGDVGPTSTAVCPP